MFRLFLLVYHILVLGVIVITFITRVPFLWCLLVYLYLKVKHPEYVCFYAKFLAGFSVVFLLSLVSFYNIVERELENKETRENLPMPPDEFLETLTSLYEKQVLVPVPYLIVLPFVSPNCEYEVLYMLFTLCFLLITSIVIWYITTPDDGGL